MSDISERVERILKKLGKSGGWTGDRQNSNLFSSCEPFTYSHDRDVKCGLRPANRRGRKMNRLTKKGNTGYFVRPSNGGAIVQPVIAFAQNQREEVRDLGGKRLEVEP